MKPEPYRTEPYTGKASGMSTSPWLACEDILGLPEPTLVINGVHKHENVEMDAGRKVERLFSISFEKGKKQMVINSTNRKTLVNAFGADTTNWIGKTVKVYVQSGVRKIGGGTTNGLRIRPPQGANPLLGGGQ